MTTYAWGGADITLSWSTAGAYVDGIGLPTGRLLQDGTSPALITSVGGWAGGKGGSRSMVMYLGGASVVIGLIANGSAVNLGMHATNYWMVQGGSTRFGYNFSGGACWFARSNGGGTTIDPGGGSWPGVAAGSAGYVIGPAAPVLNSVTPLATSGQIQMHFSGADNGGSGATYIVQRATNSGFTTGVTSVSTSSGSQIISGLAVGTTYYFRIAARNIVTDAAATTSRWSAVKSAVAPGVPGVPTSLTATASTTAFDQIKLSWTAPSNTAGGITGYSIYRGGTKVGTTTGTGTTFVDIGPLADNTSYTYTVRARNAYADAQNTSSGDSNSASAIAPGPPSPPRSLTAVADPGTAGRIVLTWTAPATAGAGGLTRYTIYQSTGAVIAASVSSGTTTYNVNGLTPGSTYNFYIRAWNAIAETVGTPGAQSNTAGDQAVGQPNAPTGLALVSSSIIANRLTLSWSESGSYTYFNIYEVPSTGGRVLIGVTKGTSYTMDNLSAGPHTYVVNARNAVTDATTPVSEGPASLPVTGTAGSNTIQDVPNISVSNATNGYYNGTFTIIATEAKKLTYIVSAPNSPLTDVSAGTITDNTNIALSGTKTIASIPSSTKLTYAATVADIAANTVVLSGTLLDATNVAFSGSFTVTTVDNANKNVSYALVHADVASVAATGTIVNSTNTVYNGTGLTITAVTHNTVQYAKTNANISLTSASGTITDTTNRDVYNGTYPVASSPRYDIVTYNKTHADVAPAAVGNPYGAVYRVTSRATLTIKYRSGWVG